MAAAPRILIVDDEPQIRRFLSLAFESAGYTVDTASCGRDAIALCSAQAFDVVLSDVMMPEMDGHQLAQWVTTHHPTVRTALMSGFDGVRTQGHSAAVYQLISKPFRPDEIVSFVAQLLGT